MPQNYISNKYLAALNQEIQLPPKPLILLMFKKVHEKKKHTNQQPERQVNVIYEAVSVLVERSSVCTSVVIKKRNKLAQSVSSFFGCPRHMGIPIVKMVPW